MIVASKAGHDRLRLYLVYRVEDESVWLTDGRLRPLEKLKKKNVRHVRIIDPADRCEWLDELADKQESGQKNAAIRKLLAQYPDLNRVLKQKHPATSPEAPTHKEVI